jgi:hypothetical protein
MLNIIKILADSVHQKVPQMKKSVYLAVLDDEGRVLMKRPNENEYSFAGVHDHDDLYFYIRFRNDGRIQFSESPTNRRFTPIQDFFRIKYPLTIVACVREMDAYCLEEKIRFAIMTADLPSTATFQNVFVEPVESWIDPISVVKRETPNRTKSFDKKLTFVAFDFDLIGDRDMALEEYFETNC